MVKIWNRLYLKLDIDHRWLSIKLLENNEKIISSTEKFLNNNFSKNSKIQKTVNKERKKLKNKNIQDTIVESIIKRAEKIYQLCVKIKTKKYNHFDRTVDNILTSKITGIPIMVLLLLGIFWITITGANYPSEVIASGLFWLQDRLLEFFISVNTRMGSIGNVTAYGNIFSAFYNFRRYRLFTASRIQS